MNYLSPTERNDGPLVPAPADEARDDAYSLPPVLIQYWQAAVRWRYVIMAIVAAALATGMLVTLLTSPLYTARSQVEISREQKNVTSVQGLEDTGGARDTEFYATQYALLKAESLAERLANKLKLADDDTFFTTHGTTPPKKGNASGQDERALRQQRERLAIQLLLQNVDISPIRNSRLVDIRYTSRSPAMSARIANAWPLEFIGATIDRQLASTADARRFLEERLATLRARLEQSERETVTYASDRGIVTLGTTRDAAGRTMEPRTLVASDLEALNSALATARADRIAAESRATTKGSDSSAEALANNTIQNLRTKRAEAAAEYARLMVQFEPGYPAARALKEQIAALDAAIARETGRVASSRNIDYDEARKRETELASQVEQLKSRLDKQQRDTIQYNIYQREADTNRQLYDALLQRYKEIGVAGSVGATNIAVVDVAKVPQTPSAPSLPKNLAIALLLGLALAGAVVFALEQIDERIRNPGDVERLLRVPVLGNVPLASGEPVTDLRDPKSELSEAYFSIRTALALTTTHGLPRSLAVTSTQKGEGKSLTSLAIASIIGKSGKRVLLVDADMRSPSVHKLAGASNLQGFSNLLAGDDHIEALVLATDMPGLSILPAGPNPPSAAELLASERLGDLIARMQSQYDYVIVDAPPVLGLADAPLIGHAVEGCLFVIEAKGAAVRAIRNALQRLAMGKDHLFGAVVTKVDLSRHGYGYGYSYAYSYGKD